MTNNLPPALVMEWQSREYDLIIIDNGPRLVMGIRCHACQSTSFHPKDVEERYCGACHVFHEDAPARRGPAPRHLN
jgi:hypothetical protein